VFCTYLALHDKPNGKGDSRVIIGQRLVHGIHAVVMSGRYRGGSMATLSSLQSVDQTNIELVSGRQQGHFGNAGVLPRIGQHHSTSKLLLYTQQLL
jgi:hypothetical protein